MFADPLLKSAVLKIAEYEVTEYFTGDQALPNTRLLYSYMLAMQQVVLPPSSSATNPIVLDDDQDDNDSDFGGLEDGFMDVSTIIVLV
jgi:hypothetical protein